MKNTKNIVLIVTDDQRFDTIHALGNTDIHTPTLDWLVENGTAFTQAHIPCGTCGAVCMPSRAMLFSGRTLFHLQNEGENIPPEHATLPQQFKNHGYTCFETGKWHNGTPAFTRSFTDGANIFFGGMWDHWNVPTSRYDPTGEYDNVINFVADFWHNNKPWQIHCDAFHPGIHSTELLTQTALDFVTAHDAEKPFFLSLNYLAPHDPRTMPEKYMKMYDPSAITLPANCVAQHPFTFGVEEIRDETLAASPRDEAEVRRNLAEYYGMITHLDDQIGLLIQALRDANILDDTLIVFTGDNGLAVGCHGLMGKQNNYDHSVRVPLLFCGPDIPKNQTSDALVYLLDLFPTLCDYMGWEVPASVEGKSFLKALHTPTYVHRTSLYFAYAGLVRAVKENHFKLIEYRSGTNQTQLFDLKADPFEQNNLAHVAAYSETLVHLRKKLLEYRDTWEDTNNPSTTEYWNAYQTALAEN
ncbi:MAG: sulfatase-like hydrolase/transferase [Ruthenibacterium sp.]